MSWKTHQDKNGKISYYVPSVIPQKTDKILMIDLDWTIIKPESGLTFPLSEKDWVFRFKLNELRDKYNNGYLIAVITNQKALLKEKGLNEEQFRNRWYKISELLAIPAYMLYSMYDDFYRKPRTGMFELLETLNGQKFDLTKSLYVGDACGRKKDFSDSDYKFALNVGIPFETPEKFFELSTKNEDQTLNLPLPIHPIKTIYGDNINFWKEYNDVLNNNFNGLIIMIGSQASGKSTFIRKHILPKFPNFVYTSLDQIKTQSKLIKIVSEELKNNKTVIIDNTNYDKKNRLIWLNLAKLMNKSIVGIYMNIDKEVSLHMNTYRSCKKIISGDDKIVPDIAIHKYYKNFEEPSKDEGFNKLLIYNLNLEFDNDNDKKNILMFLN